MAGIHLVITNKMIIRKKLIIKIKIIILFNSVLLHNKLHQTFRIRDVKLDFFP